MRERISQLLQHRADQTALGSRFREFVRWEVAPYPGRLNTVLRMTIAATLTMLIVVTFRLPNAALAGFYSILITRENLATTWRQALAAVRGAVAGASYTLLGMMLFRGEPMTHFFWVIGTLFAVFFVMRTATNFGAALGFSLVISASFEFWDRPLSSEVQVEDTLRVALIIVIGAGVTVATEAVYRMFDQSDPLVRSIDDMLLTVQRVVECAADRRALPEEFSDKLLQYSKVGTGRLRIVLLRQGANPTRRERMGALIALTSHLIHIGSELNCEGRGRTDDDAERLRAIASNLRSIRTDLRLSRTNRVIPAEPGGQPSAAVVVLPQIEQTVELIVEAMNGAESGNDHANERSHHLLSRMFISDAFHNRDYLRFALAGCTAAGVCYVVYNALDWFGISTSIITCVVTALSTIGATHQRQFLRLAGYVCGGLVIGIPAQIFILPNIDTAFQFAIFFAAGTAIAAWFATSSPRLSYFGLHMILPFYFINLGGFQAQTDLVVARDAVIGVLLGILAMGFIFDSFWTRQAGNEMQALFERNLRTLAQLTGAMAQRDSVKAMPQIRILRSQINEIFNTLASQMDAVLFEFSPRHEQYLSEREVIRCKVPILRSIYVHELELLDLRREKVPTLTDLQTDNGR